LQGGKHDTVPPKNRNDAVGKLCCAPTKST
jgi:hypothetical protein